MSTMEQVEVGKYQPYPEYKDSGVEWLGDIPSNWSVYSLKRSVTGCTNGIWGDEPNGENDLIVLRVADFDRNKLRISDDKLTYRSISEKESRSRLLAKGDLLIEKSGGGDKTLVGCVVLFDKNFAAVTSNFVAKMSAHDGYYSGFLNYEFSHLYNGRINYPSIKQTTGIQNLDSESYLMERFCFPSYTEQRTIAAFLDYETVRIDKLIAQQQRLIELLKEKRQAVISHAVTKGLNPDAPMKDSGVEWLGEVPEHWVVSSIKHLVSHPIIDGPHVSPTKHDEGVPFISAEALAGGYINFDKKWGYISPEEHAIFSKRYSPRRGDILMVKLGATTGICAMVETDEDFNIWVPLAVIRPKDSINSKFMLYLMKSDSVRNDIQISWTYGTQQTLGLATLANICVTMPPYDEQVEIVHHIEETIPVFENSITAAAKLESLLTERRTALISAAVTGKIDLRGWTAPTPEAAV